MSSGDDLKSSAHVWGGSAPEAMAIQDAPPAYAHTEAESSTSTPSTSNQPQSPPALPTRPSRRKSAALTNRRPYHPIHAVSKWITVPWSRYVVPDASVSADRTTVTTNHSLYIGNLQTLVKLLTEQAELPPIPMVRIVGNHVSAGGIGNIDFELTLNLSTLLDLRAPPKWRNRPAQVVPLPGADGRGRASTLVTGGNAVQIEVQARQFIRDKSDRKSFVLTRTVDGLPTDVIEGLVRNLMASLHYRGKLAVSFPIHCGQLVVQKKPAGAGAAVGGWFMNVLGLSPDVKYETLERVWELGSSEATTEDGKMGENGVDGDDGDDGLGGQQSDASVLVREWWAAWSPAIRDAVLLKRRGKIGIEDWMETQMGWRPVAVNHDWGVDWSS